MVDPLEKFAFFGIQTLPNIVKVRAQLVFERYASVVNFSFAAFQIILLHLHVFDFLVGNMQKLLKLLQNLRVRLLKREHLMALMISVNDTFSANGRTIASKAVVAHVLVWMLRTINMAHVHLGLSTVV